MGEHTKSRYIPKPSKHSFMGKFIGQSEGCPSCGGRLPKGQLLCEECLATRAYRDAYLRRAEDLRDIEL